ncbi:MAG: PDZ domain-containing protein [Planctomycetota bacterium]|nr:MAG: PDZ domain-containing protein [Planctomycetota bacterium]
MKYIWIIVCLALMLFPNPSLAKNPAWKLDKETTELVEKVIPAVVTIYLIPENQASVVPDRNTIYGTGIIVDSRGLVLTSLNVVNRSRHKIVVFLSDGRKFLAKRLGFSPKYGIALLKINGTNLKAISFGDSQKVRPGSLIFKFGNAFLTAQNFKPAVNMGTITGIEEVSQSVKLFRTDAGINRGDEGGPLVDIHGKLVGILLPITVHRKTNTYVSYAVPVHAIQHLIPEMKGYLGVLLTVESSSSQGAYVEAVDPSGPAFKAGIRTGDRIISFGGKDVKNGKELVTVLEKFTAGDKVEVVLMRNGKKIRLSVTLGEKMAD